MPDDLIEREKEYLRSLAKWIGEQLTLGRTREEIINDLTRTGLNRETASALVEAVMNKNQSGFEFNPKALICTILFFSFLSLNAYFFIPIIFSGAAGVLAAGLYYWMQGFTTPHTPPLLAFFITLFLAGFTYSLGGENASVALGMLSVLFFVWAVTALYLHS